MVTDPDAPSPDDPKFGEFLHWIVANIPGSEAAEGKGRLPIRPLLKYVDFVTKDEISELVCGPSMAVRKVDSVCTKSSILLLANLIVRLSKRMGVQKQPKAQGLQCQRGCSHCTYATTTGSTKERLILQFRTTRCLRAANENLSEPDKVDSNT